MSWDVQQVAQYVLYESDFTEVRYIDGSCIQLSPCGTTFICQQPSSDDSQHPVNGIGIVNTFLHVLYVMHRMFSTSKAAYSG